MWYRVLKEFEYTLPRGETQVAKPGQLVNIKRQPRIDRLRARGAIGDSEDSHVSAKIPVLPTSPNARTLRIGLWLKTSGHYSGGRIHLYQYAVAMARLGAEVFLITNAEPIWGRNYDQVARLKTLISGRDQIPDDIDVIVTDSKTGIGHNALQWKKQHPRAPFICINFETPNWIRQFCPEYADHMEPNDAYKIFPKADILLANSAESLKWCLKYIKRTAADFLHVGVLPPAINTDALDKPGAKFILPKNPYAVWVSRAAHHKGAQIASDAVWALDVPFDLVCFGSPEKPPQDTKLHHFHVYRNFGDAEKFTAMRGAHMVLAPSKFEGFGMVPFEALACNTQCIAYDLPVLRQIYGDRLDYVKWGDENDYVKRVRKCASSPREAPKGQAWAIKTWGLPAMAKRAEALPYHAVKEKRITAHMICYGTPTAPAAVEAVYPYVHQIIIAYGRVRLWNGWGDNGVLEALRAIPDPDDKITIEARDEWPDKITMRQWCADRATGNYMMMLDGDEIWTGMQALIDSDIDWGCPRWVTFWHGPEHWIYDHESLGGRRWGKRLDPYGSSCPHYRWSWWRPSYYFVQHHTPVDASGNLLVNRGVNEDAGRLCPGAVIYHLGHALPDELMQAKHGFYERRDGADKGRVLRRKVWDTWKGEVGETEDGIIERVTWKLPAQVKKALSLIQQLGVK